jgi:hypothetical protein
MVPPDAPSSPRITVVIPTYNRLPLLQRAVASALACGAPVGVHVLDNCSTDGTAVWLASSAVAGDPRIRVTRHPENIGGNANYAAGLAAVDSEYFIPLADDDELLPGFFPEALAIADRHPELVAVVGAWGLEERGVWRPDWLPQRAVGLLDRDRHIREFLQHGHYVSWSAILWRTALVHPAQGFREAQRFGLPADVYFQFRAFLAGPAYLLPRPAATFTLSDGQASARIGTFPESFRHFGDLAATMRAEVLAQGVAIPEAELDALLRATARGWSALIARNRRQAMGAHPAPDLEACIAAYVTHLMPVAGVTWFPFLDELERQSAQRAAEAPRPLAERAKGLAVRAVRKGLRMARLLPR